jgi:hypothetical protein
MQVLCQQEWGPEPVTTYIPVIEPDTIAERFLEADPTELFLSGKFAKVPLITGITKDEVSHKALCKHKLKISLFLNK